MRIEPPKPFAQIAYEAFHGGLPPMPWRELPQLSRDFWRRASEAVITAYQGATGGRS